MPHILIQCSQKRRLTLGNTLTFLSLIQVIAAWVICCCALYFGNNIQWVLTIIHGSGSLDFLRKLILACGLASLIVYIIGAKMYIDSGREATRDQFTTVFPLWNNILLLLLLTKVATISFSYWHMSKNVESSKEGFIFAMKLYMRDANLKEQIDYLQSEYKCCGADGFKDWMTAPWVPEDYNVLKTFPNRQNDEYAEFYQTVEPVDPEQLIITPYSCCDLDRIGPCIHDFTSQQTLSQTVKYEWGLGASLSQKGCAEVMRNVYDEFLNFVLQLILVNFSIDVLMMILFQYLKSSVEMIELSPNTEGISPGWFYI